MRKLVATSTLAACLACGGGNSVTGTVDGLPLNAKDALSFQAQIPITGFDAGIYEVGISLADFNGLCADFTNAHSPANATLLSLAIASTSPINPGTFNVGALSIPAASGIFEKTDANCHTAVVAQATGGTVTLTSVSGSSASGSFDVTFPDAGHMTGSFSAGNCAALANLITGDAGSTAFTCGP
jgi:hypothetical protein